MTQWLKVNNNDTLPNLASTTQTSLPHLFSFSWMTFKKNKNHFLYVIESVVQKNEIKNAYKFEV
jgi:hypothetical protein